MPRIPFDLAQVPDVNARSIGGQVGDAPVVGNRQLGGALGGLSDALGQGARVADDFAMGQARQTAASLTAANSFTPKFMALKAASAPGAPGFSDTVSQAFDQHVADSTDNIDDPMVRMAVRQNLQAQKASYVGQASEYQYAANEQNQRNVASIGLGQTYNDLAADPSVPQFQRTMQMGFHLIDNLQGVDGTTRATMKVHHMNQTALSFAKGALANVNTSADLDQFNRMLETPALKGAFAPGAYDAVLRSANTMGRMFARQEGAGLNAQLQNLNQRIDAGMSVGADEIKALENDPALMRNPGAQFRLADAKVKIQTRQTYSRSSISDLIAARDAAMHQVSQPGDPTVTASVPPEIGNAIRTASAATGCSPDYLAALSHAEYDKYLFSGDYGQGPAGGGSARGVGQVQPGTWLDLVKGNADIFGQSMKPPVSGQQLLARSDGELLALRSDPALNLVGSGIYAQQNKATLAAQLGREPTDAEVYASHVLGSGAGPRFVAAVMNTPDAPASSVVGAAVAQANSGLFKDRNGNDLSCQDAFARLGAHFSNNPNRVAYVQAQTIDRLLTNAEKQYRADPAAYAMQSGAKGMGPLSDDPQSWAQRGAAVQAFAAQQGLVGASGKRLPPMQPFTNQEAQAFAGQLANPEMPADQKLTVLANVQRFGNPQVVQAAYRQIGMKDPVGAWSGRLLAQTSDADTARSILEGRALLSRNPNLGRHLGIDPNTVTDNFYQHVGGALSELAPDATGRSIEAIAQDAAQAHYAYGAHILNSTTEQQQMDTDRYAKSVDAVLGSTKDHAAIQVVNGQPTLMARDVNADDVSQWAAHATSADLSRMSYDGTAPQYAPIPGQKTRAVPPAQMAQATFRAVSGGYYKVLLPDGRFALSGTADGHGGFLPYLVKLTGDTLHKGVSGRSAPVAGRSPSVDRFGSLPMAQEDAPAQEAPKDGEPSPVFPSGGQAASEIDRTMIDQQIDNIQADQ